MAISLILWKFVSLLGVAVAIVASVISAATYVKLERLELLMNKVSDFDIALQILSPSDDKITKGDIVHIHGKVDFRTSKITHVDTFNRVNALLKANEIEIYCLVKPDSEFSEWHVQPRPIVDQLGHFQCLASLEQQHNPSSIHKIVILAAPKNNISHNSVLKDLPVHYRQSNTVFITQEIRQGKQELAQTNY